MLKTIGASVAGIGLGTSTSSAKTTFDADFGEPLDPQKHRVTSRLPSRNVSSGVKEVTQYWGLLVYDKQATITHLEEANVTGEEFDQMVSFLNRLWKEFPVEKVHKDGQIQITLATDAKSPNILTRDDYSKLNKIASAVQTGIQNREGVQVQWSIENHQRIARDIGNQLGLWYGYVDQLYEHADDPDKWNPCTNCVQVALMSTPVGISMPSAARDALAAKINKVYHSYTHYYNPDLEFIWGGSVYDIGAFGKAPENTKKYLDQAKDAGLSNEAFKQLALSSHFLSDSAQPLHTGLEVQQATNQHIHFDYEGWVNNNWETGKQFKNDLLDNTNYYPIISASQASKDMATASHEDLQTLYTEIYNNSNWRHDETAETITGVAMHRLGLYMRGFVKDLQDSF